MATHKKIEQLENRADKTHYQGKFKDLQTFGDSYFGKRYSDACNKDTYSDYQNFLYKRALYGLKIYTKKELKSMSPLKVERIEKVHKRSWQIINLWKQERIIELSNVVFKIFNEKSLANEIINVYSKPDTRFNCKISFKELNITKDMVIDKLLEKKVLPKNFYQLK